MSYCHSSEPLLDHNSKRLIQLSRTNGTLPVGAKSPEPCVDPAYSFFFPTGAFNVEKYEVAAEGPAGTAVTFIESGYKYQCGPYTGSVGNVDTECKTINGGEFYLYQ